MIHRTLLILSLLVLSACNNTYAWRQKLTVIVQTPNGEISASSVTEVTKIESDSFWMPIEARGVSSSIRGEAVVLEVTPGRFLFVLLRGQDQLALRAFPQFTDQRDGEFRQWARSIEGHRGSGEVPPEYYPMMVTFGDIDDPKSVHLIEPSDFAQAFGTDVRLTNLLLEITEAPATTGIVESILTWLEEVGRERSGLKGKPETGLVADQPDPESYLISPSHFSTELYR